MAIKRSIYTIGHSNRDLDEFVRLLQAHGILTLVDIRSIPKSRHNPQFNGDTLPGSLRKNGIAYLQLKELGGLRKPQKDSVNSGWINASFRGYADYMQTPDFADAIKRLEAIASGSRTAIMCAEAVPWRCHRSLVADALRKRKWKVLHINTLKKAALHRYTPFLRVRKGKLVYPGST